MKGLYPFCELGVHHEVVNMLLSPGQLQFPRHDSHQEGSTPSTLHMVKVKLVPVPCCTKLLDRFCH
jgi:hypothetical protein